MSEFSATDAGMAGFAVTRNRPAVVGVWVLVMVVVNLISTVLFAAMAGPSLAAMNSMGQGGNEDPAAVIEALAGLVPAGLATIPISLLAYGVVYVALYRAILRPGHAGPAFSIGAPEFRQIAVMVLQGLALAAVYFATAIVVVGAIRILGPLGALVSLVALIVGVCFLFLVGVRLSLAGPSSFTEGRIEFTRAIALTRGRFWPMLGAYLLGFVFSVIVGILAFVIYMALAFALGGAEGMASATGAQMVDVASALAPLSLLYIVFSGVLSAFTGILLSAPAAEIYRQLAPDASAFD
ncbi:MAG: hypothetical protein ACK4RV_12305 [Caulobacter sp.]